MEEIINFRGKPKTFRIPHNSNNKRRDFYILFHITNKNNLLFVRVIFQRFNL